MKKTFLIVVLALLGVTQAMAQSEDYLPIVREGVQWVNEKVIVNNGVTPVSKFKLKDLDDKEIYVGDYASVIVVKNYRADVLAIPQNAVYSDASGDFVYEIKGDERIRRSVVLGLSDNANVEIVSGLEEGAQVYVKS